MLLLLQYQGNNDYEEIYFTYYKGSMIYQHKNKAYQNDMYIL